MPDILTPSATPRFPSALSVPRNGENLDASQEAALDQILLDGGEAARLLTQGAGLVRRCACSDGVNIIAAPFGVAQVQNAGGAWVTLLNYTATANNTFAINAPAANTAYWIYLYDVGGAVPEFVASVDAPDDSLQYKNGDKRYLYFSRVITDHAAQIVAYSHVDNQYIYSGRTAEGSGARGNLLLDAGNATVATNVALAGAVAGGVVPVGASQVLIQARATTSAAGPVVLLVYYLSTRCGLALPVYTTAPLVQQFEYAPAPGSEYVSYVTTSAVTDACSLWAAGFTL